MKEIKNGAKKGVPLVRIHVSFAPFYNRKLISTKKKHNLENRKIPSLIIFTGKLEKATFIKKFFCFTLCNPLLPRSRFGVSGLKKLNYSLPVPSKRK